MFDNFISLTYFTLVKFLFFIYLKVSICRIIGTVICGLVCMSKTEMMYKFNPSEEFRLIPTMYSIPIKIMLGTIIGTAVYDIASINPPILGGGIMLGLSASVIKKYTKF